MRRKGHDRMNVNRMGRAIVVVAVAVGLGVGVGHAALADRASHAPSGHATATATATPSPTPGPSPKPPVTRPGRPARPATTVDGAAAANQVANWTVIQPGTPAAWYWGRHGVPATSPYSRCEAALRVQFVRGYADPGADDAHQPLWRFECQGVTDAERDSILQAAVEWGSTHANGDD